MLGANEGNQMIRVHIDRKPYESPNPTTGEALYRLAGVTAHRELFREVTGNEEDVTVPKDGTQVKLEQDEHFYTEREYDIIVNARKKDVTTKTLSFNEVVALAFDNPPTGPNIEFTITYRNGPKVNRDGILAEGQTVTIKNGMVFNVTPTNKS